MHRIKVYMSLTFIFTVSAEHSRGYHQKRHLPKDCGRTRFDDGNPRIVGGIRAYLGQFPWMARIGIKQEKKEEWFFCGGSLINRYYVVSAAHCEETGNIVRLGESDTETPIDCDDFGDCAPPHQDIGIKAYKFANYCRTISENDIMLIELEEPAKLNEFVQPICLPTTNEVLSRSLVNEFVVLSGWGSVDGRNPLEGSKHLMYIIVPVTDFKTCKRTFPDITEGRQICMGQSRKGRNACNGDSGGSAAKAVKVNGVHRMYLFGVASYVQANCQGGAVYTNVPYYMDFILNGIEKS
ncbi:venom protease-like [Anoplophora glabripennis]|uniref:venom protease-like n=1 Tax=Anoplophora glabripennis TaxID=217634 RepID=UPI0008739A76|nr:venom protease-like [Anoplophora glabripennis]